ncbi:MAG TPA: hypothetical protein VK705_12555 [Ferruginibacter sp.]|jgi:hypothetical protein|nr:hypothetical protein [Ferruginibacter sp.]
MKLLSSLPILLLFIFYSCSNNKQTKIVSNIKTDTVVQKIDSLKKDSIAIQTAQPEIVLDTFSSTPADTIGGCTATFSADSISYTKEHYIFMADYTGFAAIKIGGNLIFLHPIYKGQKENIDNDSTYVGTFGGEGYTVRVKTTISRVEGDEYATYNGTIEVSRGRHKTIFTIHGSVGC